MDIHRQNIKIQMNILSLAVTVNKINTHTYNSQHSLGRSTQKLLIKLINKHKQGMILVNSTRLGNTKILCFP